MLVKAFFKPLSLFLLLLLPHRERESPLLCQTLTFSFVCPPTCSDSLFLFLFCLLISSVLCFLVSLLQRSYPLIQVQTGHAALCKIHEAKLGFKLAGAFFGANQPFSGVVFGGLWTFVQIFSSHPHPSTNQRHC